MGNIRIKDENMNKTTIITNVQTRLFELQDLKYRDFHAKLMPTVNKEKIIGVRTPALRVFAKKYGKTDEAKEYLQILPHQYYEENNLHGLLIEQIKDYDICLEELERFLPYIDNWATCDMLAVKVVKKHLDTFIDEVYRWMESDHAYTIRFGISMLMRYYLEDAFQMEYPEKVAQIRSEEYYVNMMCAWYFATALAKQYDKILPFIEKQKLDVWTHNKTIQKAIESYRITPEQKEYLKGLKIKNEIYIHLYDHKKSEYRTAAKTGTSVIRKRLFSENAGMGTGKYESTDSRIGNLYGGCICTSFLLFVSDSETGKRI